MVVVVCCLSGWITFVLFVGLFACSTSRSTGRRLIRGTIVNRTYGIHEQIIIIHFCCLNLVLLLTHDLGLLSRFINLGELICGHKTTQEILWIPCSAVSRVDNERPCHMWSSGDIRGAFPGVPTEIWILECNGCCVCVFLLSLCVVFLKKIFISYFALTR